MGQATLRKRSLAVKPLIERDDLVGDPPPPWLQSALISLGGRNIYQEPMFRMAFAENVRKRVGCTIPLWPKDADGRLIKDPNHVIPIRQAVEQVKQGIPLAEVTRQVLWQADQNQRPLRTEEPGMKWVKKYSFTGYIIERYNPPHMYGNPVEWEAVRIAGFPVLGPFPSQGDYEYIGGSEGLSEWPSTERITSLIEWYWTIQESQPESPQQRMLLRIKLWEEQEKEQWKSVYEEFEPETREMTEFLMNSVSLEAERYREKIFRENPALRTLG